MITQPRKFYHGCANTYLYLLWLKIAIAEHSSGESSLSDHPTLSEYQKSLWISKLHVSPEPLGFIEDGNRTVSVVYGHSDNEIQANNSAKLYYYSPICQVDFVSDHSDPNGKLRLTIQVWNEDLEDHVLDYLSEWEGHEIQPEQIRLLPFDKFYVALSSQFRSDSIGFHGISSWEDYESTRSQMINLTSYCFSREDCSWVESKIRSFADLGEVHFSTALEIGKRKNVSFQYEELINEDLLGKIGLIHFPDNVTEVLFIETQLMYNLLDEHVQIILMPSLEDSHSCNSTEGSRILIIEEIKKLLELEEVVKGGPEDGGDFWDSLHWPGENRPDKVARMYNDVYNNLLNEEQQEMFTHSYERIKIHRVREVYESGNISSLFTIGVCDDDNRHADNSSCSEDQVTSSSIILDCPLFYNCHVLDVVEYSWSSKSFIPVPQFCFKMNFKNLPNHHNTTYDFTVNYTTALFSVPI